LEKENPSQPKQRPREGEKETKELSYDCAEKTEARKPRRGGADGTLVRRKSLGGIKSLKTKMIMKTQGWGGI